MGGDAIRMVLPIEGEMSEGQRGSEGIKKGAVNQRLLHLFCVFYLLFLSLSVVFLEKCLFGWKNSCTFAR